MAIASATQAQQLELLRQLNIAAKDLYAITTQPLDISQTGPAFDTVLVALATAITAVQAAS